MIRFDKMLLNGPDLLRTCGQVEATASSMLCSATRRCLMQSNTRASTLSRLPVPSTHLHSLTTTCTINTPALSHDYLYHQHICTLSRLPVAPTHLHSLTLTCTTNTPALSHAYLYHQHNCTLSRLPVPPTHLHSFTLTCTTNTPALSHGYLYHQHTCILSCIPVPSTHLVVPVIVTDC